MPTDDPTPPEGDAVLDRTQAGVALAGALRKLATSSDVLVLGLARGGVPAARAVADALRAPLDVLVPCRLTVPGIDTVPLGVAIDGTRHVETDSIAWYIGIPEHVLTALRDQHAAEVQRRVLLYRDGHPVADARDSVVVLVDDGIVTGLTMRAAARAIRAHRPRRIIAAVPVATRAGMAAVRREVDELVVLRIADDESEAADAYTPHPSVSDIDVMRLLGRSVIGRPSLFAADPRFRAGGTSIFDTPRGAGVERRIEIPVGTSTLTADLGMPRTTMDSPDDDPRGLVILAHAGAGARQGYDSRYLAGRLRLGGYATLRLDLSTRREQQRASGDGSIDVLQLGARLVSVCAWTHLRGIGGASRTILLAGDGAAAAAVHAASDACTNVAAVVAMGGAVDAVDRISEQFRSPLLMIVGGADDATLARSRSVARRHAGSAHVVRIARASRALEDAGALGAAAEHAVDWLDRLVVPRRSIADFTRQYRRLLARRA